MLSIKIEGSLMMKIEVFLHNLYQYDWDTIKTHQDTNEAYNNFILTFCTIYDTFFVMNKMKMKTKDLESPWITTRIKKYSKKKHRLYSKLKKTNKNKNKKKNNIKITKNFLNLSRSGRRIVFS